MARTASARWPRASLAGLAAAAQCALPSLAAACPSCLYGAYGDRTFNWAFLGLLAMPFFVIAGIGGAFLHRQGLLRMHHASRAAAPGPDHLAAHEETT
jgi:hypothetical protein